MQEWASVGIVSCQKLKFETIKIVCWHQHATDKYLTCLLDSASCSSPCSTFGLQLEYVCDKCSQDVTNILWPESKHATRGRMRCWVQQAGYTGGKPLFTHRVRAEYMVGSETKYPPGTCWVFSKSTHHRTRRGWPWFTHWVHLYYFYISPTLHPPKYPLGTCWVFLQSTHPDTHQSSRWVHSKSTHQEPSG